MSVGYFPCYPLFWIFMWTKCLKWGDAWVGTGVLGALAAISVWLWLCCALWVCSSAAWSSWKWKLVESCFKPKWWLWLRKRIWGFFLAESLCFLTEAVLGQRPVWIPDHGNTINPMYLSFQHFSSLRIISPILRCRDLVFSQLHTQI